MRNKELVLEILGQIMKSKREILAKRFGFDK